MIVPPVILTPPTSQTVTAAYLASKAGSQAPCIDERDNCDVTFVDCNGGSVVGAAVLAAVATTEH